LKETESDPKTRSGYRRRPERSFGRLVLGQHLLDCLDDPLGLNADHRDRHDDHGIDTSIGKRDPDRFGEHLSGRRPEHVDRVANGGLGGEQLV